MPDHVAILTKLAPLVRHKMTLPTPRRKNPGPSLAHLLSPFLNDKHPTTHTLLLAEWGTLPSICKFFVMFRLSSTLLHAWRIENVPPRLHGTSQCHLVQKHALVRSQSLAIISSRLNILLIYQDYQCLY